MLTGPPGAGKSTYVKNNRGPDDCQVDMDLIPRHLEQSRRRSARKHLLHIAAQSSSPGTCWFQTAAPTREQRDYWRFLVPIEQTMIFLPPMQLAIERQISRDGRTSLTYRIPDWYEKYDPPTPDEPNTVLVPVG